MTPFQPVNGEGAQRSGGWPLLPRIRGGWEGVQKTPGGLIYDHASDSYPKLGVGKGKGERDTIRLGTVTPGSRMVIDDQQAFFVAARFDSSPITLLDLIVELTRSRKISKTTALKFVNAISGRYAAVSVVHTIYKLSEVTDDPNHH
jgi:hypothetical protein